MRIAVIDKNNIPLMPCTPVKARMLLKQGKAKPKRDKLGLFYIQLVYTQKPENQPLAIGIDPGSKFEGFTITGSKDVVTNLMVETPTHVKKALETRKNMRRARRFRKWRRPKRVQNRLRNRKFLPPSTRSRWEAKYRVVIQLLKTMPITDTVIEDVQAVTKKGQNRKWNASFSPVQCGKEHFYTLLRNIGLNLILRHGYETKALRDQYGLKKTSQKNKKSFDSHAVDSFCLASVVSGLQKPTCKKLWYLVPVRLYRRQLHRLQASVGGERKPYGGTRSLGLKRGTLVKHPKYGLCAIGGCDGKKQRVSVHEYKTNKRLAQNVKVSECKILTSLAFRSWLVK